jgi:predicted DNA-binding WGR domain protein
MRRDVVTFGGCVEHSGPFEEDGMLLRELIGGDPPYACKFIFIDDPTGFGHRATDGEKVVEHVLTKKAEFDRTVMEKLAEGFTETERSLSRRVFATVNKFWIVMLDGDTLRVQFGGIRVNWRESSGQTKGKLFRDRERAVAAYQKAIEGKRAEGYREKYGRKVPIPATSKEPKKPGKKGSR